MRLSKLQAQALKLLTESASGKWNYFSHGWLVTESPSGTMRVFKALEKKGLVKQASKYTWTTLS